MNIKVERTSVHCEASDHDRYRSWTRGGAHDALEVPFSTMVNAFVAFASLGYRYDRYELLVKRQEIFLSISIDQSLQLPVLASLAFARLRAERPDAPTAELTQALASTRTIIPIVEGWANGGIRVFEEVMESGSPHATLALYDQVADLLPSITGSCTT